MRYLFYTATVFFFLNSCNFREGCTKVTLSNEQKKWFDAYDSSDVVFFKSNLGNIDTFTVTSKDDYYTQCNRFELSEYQYNLSVITLRSSNCHGKSSHNCFAQIQFKSNDESADETFRVFDLRSYFKHEKDTILIERIILNTSNKEYESRLFERGKSATSSNGNFIQSFNWNRGAGLIRYTTHKGEVFDLWKFGK